MCRLWKSSPLFEGLRFPLRSVLLLAFRKELLEPIAFEYGTVGIGGVEVPLAIERLPKGGGLLFPISKGGLAKLGELLFPISCSELLKSIEGL